MMLFLDTEWADVLAKELVSLALISKDLVFYAERKKLPETPTDFVRSVVYPLLTRGHWALHDFEFAERLRAFVARATARDAGRPPTICYDYQADKSLFERAYRGFGEELANASPVSWFDLTQLNPHYSLGVESYFARNSLEAGRRHHALVDAKGALAGYRAAVDSLAQDHDFLGEGY